jgi:hypothetical protein
MVKIIKVFEQDEHTLRLRVKDQTNKVAFIMMAKLKFQANHLRVGDIVKIKSVKKSEMEGCTNELDLSSVGNVLKFPKTSLLIENLKQKITQDSEADKIALGD